MRDSATHTEPTTTLFRCLWGRRGPHLLAQQAHRAPLRGQQQDTTGQLHQADPWYRFEWDGGKQQLDAEQLWVGRINRLPMPHCNLKLTGNGKLVQRRAIATGEALTFDSSDHDGRVVLSERQRRSILSHA